MCRVPYSSANDSPMSMPGSPDPSSTRSRTPTLAPTSSERYSSSIDLSGLDPLPSGTMLRLPSFEDFEFVGCLGSGGHGTVYCARHTSSKKYVAIKVADGCNTDARHQLEMEKQILCRYGHKNPYMIKAYCSFHRGVRRCTRLGSLPSPHSALAV